jgi:predicted pyridoxine 5'-phosphate oxidase superfamily flavin-nucleotide-binding protein
MQTVLTPSVLAAQEHYYGRHAAIGSSPERDALTEDERSFIQARDSFYMASITENGWPYVQHRGGQPGFLRVVSSTQIAFADYKGNRQMISTGNLAANDRVALILMNYPQRERLKILGHVRIEDARAHPELVEKLAEAETRGIVERLYVVDVLSYDWNCSKYITPRYTVAEVEETVEVLKQRLAQLEAQIKNTK